MVWVTPRWWPWCLGFNSGSDSGGWRCPSESLQQQPHTRDTKTVQLKQQKETSIVDDDIFLRFDSLHGHICKNYFLTFTMLDALKSQLVNNLESLLQEVSNRNCA